ncbi:MAG: Maf-like protein, partial [Clostridia bacterium]|nr:Maf-like protein [Clostridia bacterium]
MKTVILASQSPRRQELLGRILDDFIVRCDTSEEVKIPGEAPEIMVQRLALTKAKNVAKMSCEDALVIGADTVVVLEGRVLGKPKDEEDARTMLTSLSGREHTVYTGVAVLDTATGAEETMIEGTKVRFKVL